MVSGFSTTPKSFAQTLQPTNSLPNAALAAAATASFPAPDLMSVHCTSRSLCFAAGGYFARATAASQTRRQGALAAVGTTAIIGAVATAPFIVPGSLPVAGAILRSTNGGTMWSYVIIPPMIGATSTLPAQPVPGIVDISTDSSGRNVYAVGAPFIANDYAPPATNLAPSSYGPGLLTANTAYSTNPAPIAGAQAAGTIIVRSHKTPNSTLPRLVMSR